MCTALRIVNDGLYFGRNLDLDQSYGEKICILPRNFPIPFCRMGIYHQHYAIIGMAVVAEGIPLFYDGTNEQGLCMAGLNFPGNAWYPAEAAGKDNVSPFELIPWILSQCSTVAEARQLLARINLAAIPYSHAVPLSPLHWIISDREGSIVVESTIDGFHVYENPANVLTNNPPLPYQLFHLNNFRSVSPATPENRFAPQLDLDVYAQGLGGLGLPGDVSSMSRFVRAAFLTSNCVCEPADTVGQFFHLLGNVEMPRGICRTDTGVWDITVYSSCIHADTGRYYYSTYNNRQISCIDMSRENLDGNKLLTFPLKQEQQIFWQNK